MKLNVSLADMDNIVAEIEEKLQLDEKKNGVIHRFPEYFNKKVEIEIDLKKF